MAKRKPGNPNMVKGGPSINPSGRSAGREFLNKDIEHAIHAALTDEEHGGSVGYMKALAKDKPALFVGLLQKVMPNDVAAHVHHTIIDLGSAMREAETRMAKMQSMIDVTPSHPQPKRVSDQSGERETLQPLDLKAKS